MNQAKYYPEIKDLRFDKYSDGLMPAVVQDATTLKVLMVGFMNQEAYAKTIEKKLVTFYSRSRKELWTKGETSNNFLHVIDIKADCDHDSLLVTAKPDGPVCHTGSDTCFDDKNSSGNFLIDLEKIIADRKDNLSSSSYTSSLFKKGMNAIAQKVGEEAVELIIEAKDSNNERFLNEGADLLFHYLILLQAKGFTLTDIADILEKRNNKK